MPYQKLTLQKIHESQQAQFINGMLFGLLISNKEKSSWIKFLQNQKTTDEVAFRDKTKHK